MAQNTAVKDKKTEISILNVLFCLMVLTIHTLSQGMVMLNPASWQFMSVYIPWELCSVAVYGFIYLSGVKLFLKFDRPFSAREFYSRRLRSIIVPYVVAVSVYYLAFCALGVYSFSLWYWLKFILLGNAASHFYFIVALAQFYLLMPLWRQIVGHISPAIALGAALVINILFWPSLGALCDLGVIGRYTDRILFSYLFYWLLGCYVGRYYNSFLQTLRENKWAIILCFLIAALGCLHFYYYAQYGGLYFGYLELWQHFYLVSAIVFLSLLSNACKEWRFAKSRLFNFLNRHSYKIYLWHMLFLLACEYILRYFPTLNVGFCLILRGLSVTVGTGLFCLVWEKFAQICRPRRIKQK